MRKTGPGSFALSVAEWAQHAKANSDQVLRAVCIGLLNEIVTASPVGNPDLWKGDKYGFIRPPPGYVGGRFRANWQVSVGTPASGELDQIDATGGVSISAGQTVINGVRCGPSVYIVNNLPYAIPLEYGHSKQAPVGMVGRAQLRFHNLVEKSVRELDQMAAYTTRPTE